MGAFVFRNLRFAALAAVAALTLSIGSGPPAVTAQPPSGDLIAWGSYGPFPQPTPTPLPNPGALAGKTVTSLDVGPWAACAVADGAVYCWSADPARVISRSNIPAPVDTTGVLTGRTVTSVSVGGSSACVVADGRVYCWGSGSLGSGSYASDVPVAVDTSGALAGKTVTSVSVGDDLSCVVADGGLYCWGPGGIAGSTLPRAIEADGVFAGKSVTAVSTGSYSTCVIADATVYCTRNSWTFSPVGGPALGGKAVTAISAGGNMGTTACAVAEGRVYCWGAGRRGQLGDGKRAYSYEPVAVDVSGVLAGQDVQAIAVGMYHACALANGRTFCWGDDSMGQTGSGLQHAGRSYALVPAAVAGPLSTTGGPAVSVLAADATNSCAVASGVVYCWGWGLATLVRNGEAYQVSGFSGLTRIEDYCGIIRGRVYCWGEDKSSQRSAVPVAVPGLGHGRVTDLSAGWAHACAVVKGRAYCWGANSYGQLGNGTRKKSTKAVRVTSKAAWGSQRVSTISAGRTHTCAVAVGKAYCWGTGDLGRPSVKRSTTPVRVPLAAKRVTAISAGPAEWVYEDPQDEVDTFTGRTDTCAVADGRLFCWGWNTAGQLGIGHRRNAARPTPVTGGDLKGKVVAVSLSGDSTARTCAIAAGRVYCWGLGGLGVSGRRSSTLPIAVKRLPDDERVTDLAVGGNTCALVSGAVWCWGSSGRPAPRRVDVSGLKQPGRVVDISQSGNWGIWETR